MRQQFHGIHWYFSCTETLFAPLPNWTSNRPEEQAEQQHNQWFLQQIVALRAAGLPEENPAARQYRHARALPA